MTSKSTELQRFDGGARSSLSHLKISSSNTKMTLEGLNTALNAHLEAQDPNQDWSAIAQYYLQQAAKIRGKSIPCFRNQSTQSSMFFDLPIEIRHMIYELVYTPSMVHAHILRNKKPALFHVNQAMHLDFSNFYYSRKIFQMAIFNPNTSLWEEITDPVWTRAAFEEWLGCNIATHIYPIRSEKSGAERWPSFRMTSIFFSSDTHRIGVLQWLGAPKTRCGRVQIYAQAKPVTGQTRYSQLAAYEARVLQWE